MAGRREKKEPNADLQSAAAQARAAGMTYGQFTAKKYLEEEMEKRRKEREEAQRAKLERQAEWIKAACEQAGLGSHVSWFSEDAIPNTAAANIALEVLGRGCFPTKSSFMFCDELDMCFFYDGTGRARMSFSGETKAGSDDIKHNFAMAFKTAEKVLDIMQELSDNDK